MGDQDEAAARRARQQEIVRMKDAIDKARQEGKSSEEIMKAAGEANGGDQN